MPLRSGFDKSHHNLLTSKVGTITPVLVDELVANSKVSVKMALSAQLPPLASDCFLKASIKTEAFFVPMRLLYAGFEDFFCDNAPRMLGSSGYISSGLTGIPKLVIHNNYDSTATDPLTQLSGQVGPGTLIDYLGMRGTGFIDPTAAGYKWTISMMPFLAYHLIWDQWYRATTIQNSCFLHPGPNLAYSNWYTAATLPYSQPNNQSGYLDFHVNAYMEASLNPGSYKTSITTLNNGDYKKAFLADDKPVTALRQRNFGFDYFTNAQPTVAYNGDAQVTVSSSKFTIAALRAANSLQQWRERNSIAGTRFSDVLSARFGANLSAGVAQRPVFLGSAEYPLFSRSVSVTGDNTNANNPFAGAAGGEVARAYASGSDFIVNNFVANEPGFLFINATLVPKVTYSSGMRRYLKHYASLTDFADPIFQNVGNQEILQYELSADACSDTLTQIIFGYTDRYAEYMTMEDEIHGLMTEGESLASFASQRYLDGTTTQINTDFLEIPTDYLDDVTVVSETLSDYGYWMDIDFQYHVSMPLSEYSMPSLQDPAYEHGQSVTVHRGGFRF